MAYKSILIEQNRKDGNEMKFKIDFGLIFSNFFCNSKFILNFNQIKRMTYILYARIPSLKMHKAITRFISRFLYQSVWTKSCSMDYICIKLNP